MNTSNLDNDSGPQHKHDANKVKYAYHSAVHDEPRAMIDDAIRAAARRAVSSGPTSIGKRWTARWTTPLAAAATVMLTSSVIFMAVRDRPEVAPPLAEMVSRDEAKTMSVDVAKAAKPIAPAAENYVTEKQTDARANARADAAALSAPATPTAPASATPAPAPSRVAQSLQLNQVIEKKLPVPVPVPVPAAPVVVARAQDSSNKSAQAPALPSIKAPPQDNLLPAPVKQFAPSAELARAAPAAPSLSAPKALQETKKEAANGLYGPNASTVSRGKLTDSEATAALTAQAISTATPPQVVAAPAPAALEKSSPFSARAVGAAADKNDKAESAEAWIKRMTELKRQEKNKELVDEIARFRKRYPSVELPKELVVEQN